jgi:hypothetical protein
MKIQAHQKNEAVDTPLEFGKFVYLMFSGILLVMLGLYIYKFGTTLASDQAIWGAFGDFLGGTLNPLVSFLTLIVAVSVWKLQKDELAMTRKTLQESMEVAKTQANLMSVQRIEQTMFSLIEQLRQSIKDFSVAKNFNRINGPGDLNGSEAVRSLDSALDVFNREERTAVERFDEITRGYLVQNFDALALGIKELLGFITRSSSNDESRKIWFGMCIALLGERSFKLAFKWGERYNDPVLLSYLIDMNILRATITPQENLAPC